MVFTAQSSAAFRLGVPVTRGPYTSATSWIIHIIFELFVSSARMCAYTPETPGACGNALGSGGIRRSGRRCRIRHEVLHRTVFRAADANAAAAGGVKAIAGLAVARLRIGDVEHIVLINVNATGPAELLPLGDEMTFLIENLVATFFTVPHEQPPLQIT